MVEALGAPAGARADQLPVEHFIPPELRVDLPAASDGPANVILIYAPAAVGKSVMARDLARQSQNPYWDLAAFRLGSSFFNGTISETYGVDAAGGFVAELQRGDVCLILDAADEASVGSTSTGYAAAIDNLAGLLSGTSPHHSQAVIFGREETILATAAMLDAHSVTCEVLSVRYFASDRAREFVRVLATDGHPERALVEFDNFLDEFFDKVTDALGSTSWADVESFLGYAPVLDSVATFYRTADNPYVELKRMEAPSSRLAVWELLHDLILDILQREQGKFANSFGGVDDAKRRFAASAYGIEDQCRLLLAIAPSEILADPEMDNETDLEWLTDIDLKLHDWFSMHPFTPAYSSNGFDNPLKAFSNVAFRDFIVARAAREDDSELHSNTASFLRAHDVNPSVILSRFLEVSAVRGEIKRIPGSLLGAITDSHAAGGIKNLPLWLLEKESPTLDETSRPQILLAFQGSGDGEYLTQLVVDVAGPVLLGRHVSNLVALIPSHEVALGDMVSEAQVGPMALIRCSTFTSRSPEVRVVGSGDHRVIVEAEGVGGITRIVHGVPDSLAMRVPPIPYPWGRFRAERASPLEYTRADLLGLGLELRTIATWFGMGSGTFEVDKMDTILAKGRASRRMFDVCVREDFIWRDELDYRFRNPFSNVTVRSIDLSQTEYRRWLERAWREIQS